MTIKDIARETGYAISTVSRALNDHPDINEETKRRIRSVVEAHNFVPNANARQLKQSDTQNIALLVKGTSNMLFPPMIEQMQEKIQSKGYTDLVFYLDENDNEVIRAIQIIRETKPLGLLFLGASLPHFRQEYGEIRIPGVLVTNSAKPLRMDNLSSVYTDDEAAAQEAVTRLIQQGHRYIGVVGGPLDVNSTTSELRYRGCMRAMLTHGIVFDTEKQYKAGRYSFRSAYQRMLLLLDEMPGLTAVFAMSDVMAIGAIRAIRDCGLRVPEDISVIGFDGIELASYYNPKLATMRQDQDLLSKRAVEILTRRIDDREAVSVHEVIPYTFQAGESLAEMRSE